MSDTWDSTRASLRRLKTAFREADEDTRYKFVFWVSGLSIMGIAIIVQFGWTGVLFCLGMVLWKIGPY